jgi:hypothetical protein
MQSTAVRQKSKAKRLIHNEVRKSQEESAMNEFASKIMQLVMQHTYAGVQSLHVWMEPNRVTLTGLCESYHIKQLAQQAILGMVGNREIVNDIAVI